MLSRRLVLLSPLAAAACGGPLPPAETIGIVAQDVNILASGLAGALTQLAVLKVPGLTPDLLNTCQAALAGIRTTAQSIAGVGSPQQAQPLVQRIEGYVNAFVGALAVLPLPAPIPTILAAASILLPVIEVAVGLFVPNVPASPAAENARTVLAGK